MGSSKRDIQADFSHGTWMRDLANWKYGFWGIHLFPAWLCDDGLENSESGRRANLSHTARRYLAHLDLGVEDLFHHSWLLFTIPPTERPMQEALRMEWPRIPLPGWPHGKAKHAAELARSAARGRDLTTLLDPERPRPVSRRHPCVRSSRSLVFPPPPTEAT